MDMHQLINIFCDIDDFSNELEHHCQNYMLSGPTKSNRGPSCCIAISDDHFSDVSNVPIQGFQKLLQWLSQVLSQRQFP